MSDSDADAWLYYRRVAARIRRFREERRWSQRELAARVQYSQGSVRQWELGRIMPRVDAQVALARAFRVHPDDLFSFKRLKGDEE